MDAEAFNTWLAAMKLAGLARSDAEAAKWLGVTAWTVCSTYKKVGCPYTMAMAAQAALRGLPPYGSDKPVLSKRLPYETAPTQETAA